MFFILRNFLLFSGYILFLFLFTAFTIDSGAAASGGRPESYHVAMRSFGVWEPETGERFDFSVWYPSKSESVESIREGWIVPAGARRRIQQEFFPIVLVSHDAASSRFANNDLLTAIAAGGVIVIAPTHTGDSQTSTDLLFTPQIIKERPRHLVRALEYVLASPDFAPYADESRIGLLGVGVGSVTAFQLLGAIPDFSRLEGYCGAASGQDVFCAPWIRERLASLPKGLEALMKKEGPDALVPSLGMFAPRLLIPAVAKKKEETKTAEEVKKEERRENVSLWNIIFGDKENEEKENLPLPLNTDLIKEFENASLFGDEEQTEQFVPIVLPESLRRGSRAEKKPVQADKKKIRHLIRIVDTAKKAFRRPATLRRIQAVALLTPAGGMLFDRNSLASVQLPVAIVEAGGDVLYPPAQHSYPYSSALSVQAVELSLPDVDHFSLFAECSRESKVNLGSMCGALVGDARAEIAEQRDKFISAFFQSVLGGPTEAHTPEAGFVELEEPLPEAKGKR